MKQREAFNICDSRIQEFLYLVSSGHPVRSACRLSGISDNTMRAWLNPSNARYKPSLFKLFHACKKEGDNRWDRD
jgi:hypothetical protein